jgi:hypothetical protein
LFGIDVQGLEAWHSGDTGRDVPQARLQNGVEVRCGICTDEQNTAAGIRQQDSARTSERGLADAALPGEEEVTGRAREEVG